VFKNSTEWKKLEVAESDFYTDFLVNSACFSEIGASRSCRISEIFRKTGRIFKPWLYLLSCSMFLAPGALFVLLPSPILRRSA
jgi:hypothetical protein